LSQNIRERRIFWLWQAGGELKCFAKITLKLRDLGKEIFVLSVATSHNSIRIEKEDMM